MDIEINNLDNYKHIHLIGIGGVSMSAIAETLKSWGFEVTGSDLNSSRITDKLNEHGIRTVIGHNLDDCENADLVIYNAAIPEDDPEMCLAREKNIPTVGRGKFVGFLTKKYKEAICVSGTHGKTTTTSMLSSCFLEAKLDPSIEVGAYLNLIDGNYRIGKSEYFILESCEYKANFLNFFPDTAIILNIDNDHLDFYKTFENVVKAFQKFASLVDENGLLVVNGDDKNCLSLKEYAKSKFVTYGIENDNCNYVAKNIKFDDNGFANFDVYKDGEFFENIELSVTGKHNVLNSLATIAVSDYYKISKDNIKDGLKKFTGASRRLEYKGEFGDNIRVFDDYAHHPTEILATYSAVKNKKYHESWVIFQPHTFSRTKTHLDAFAEVLSKFDNIILTDIYAAREKDEKIVSSKDIVNKIEKLGKKAKYIPEFKDIVTELKKNAKKDDIIITLGAGTITNLGPMLVTKNN